ncbi:MAG: alpha/beta fold hydrolase [Candidatus Hodarchaeota archaeon]
MSRLDMPRVKLQSGIELNYRLQGSEDKPLIVMMHGYTGSHQRYAENYQDDFKDDYQFLVYDHKGHGDSDKPAGKTEEENISLYSLDQLATDLHDLLVTLKIDGKDLVLIGHSMGGMVALSYYFLFPSRVKALVIISSMLGYIPRARDAMLKILDSYKKKRTWSKERILNENIRLSYSARFFRDNYDLMEKQAEARLKTSQEARIYCMENYILHYDLKERAPDIQVPVLTIHGTRDGVINYRYAKEMGELIPNCELHLIQKGSHQITDENKEEVLEKIKQFLNRIQF